MLGVFTFAGVVTLPWYYLLTLVAVIYLTIWPTFRRAGAKLHRHAYTAGSVAVGCWGASAIYTALGRGLVAVPAGVLTFTVLNAGTIAVAIAVARHHEAWPMFLRPSLYGVMMASMGLGVAVGAAVQWHAVAGYAGLPVILAVHLRAARNTVEESGACVGGIWNRAGWLALAEEAHRLGERFAAVLVDLMSEHEANVAAEIVQARLGGSPVGRYGPTQLVVLLRHADDTTARYLGYRLGKALRSAELDAGVGCSGSTVAGSVAGMLASAAAEAVICRVADAAPDLR